MLERLVGFGLVCLQVLLVCLPWSLTAQTAALEAGVLQSSPRPTAAAEACRRPDHQTFSLWYTGERLALDEGESELTEAEGEKRPLPILCLSPGVLLAWLLAAPPDPTEVLTAGLEPADEHPRLSYLQGNASPRGPPVCA